MHKTSNTFRQLLMPNGSQRARIVQTFYSFLLMFRQQISSGQGINLSTLRRVSVRTLLRQATPRKLYQNFRSLWLRGNSSVSHLQAAYLYQDWIDKTEPDAKQLAEQRKKQFEFSYKPLVSFLTPVYNPSVSVIRDTLNSVQAQTYDLWEFCLANGSTDPDVGRLLDEFSQQDQRFRVIHLSENLGISENTNRALEMAQGDFIALLDHDDLVSPNMLYEIVSALNEELDWDVIYFDEDKISEDGQARNAPWFKPSEWSPDLLLSTNYLMHSVIRRQLIVDLGKFDSNMDGAQDWDLALRLAERTRKIHHIPQVFYHWRQVIGSAARDANAKPWAYVAQERCIQNHLQRQGHGDVNISFPRLGAVRLIWPSQNAKVSIIIPTKDKVELLQACIESIVEKTTYQNYEILIVDNQSNDSATANYYKTLSDNARVQILDYPYSYNYQKINNWAAHQSNGDVLLFLNNDTEIIDPAWLDEIAGWAIRPETGVVGTKLLRPNGKIQHGGLVIGLMGHGSHVFEDCDDHAYTHFGSVDWYRNYRAMTGACMAVRRTVFNELSGLDEAYIIGFGDIDFCLRAKDAGYRNVYTPFATLLHHEGGTRGLSLPLSDVLRASVKMFNMVQMGDGFFNPNLSYSSRQPTVAAKEEEDRGNRLVRIMQLFGIVGIEMDAREWANILSSISPELLVAQPKELLTDDKEMNRILIVTHELTRSGAPIILWILAKYLKECGYSVQIISPVDGPLKDDYIAEHIPISVVSGLLEDPRASIPFLDGTDVVLCNTILTWRVVHAARAFSRPCLWWVHETEFGAGLVSQQPQIAEALSAATHIIFPSQTTANLYRQYLNQENYSYLFYGFDVDVEGTDISAVISKQPDELHLVCVGTIEKRKGQDVLLDAISLLPLDIASKTHCYLIGRTRLDPIYYLKIAWRSYWKKNIHLVGEIPNSQVMQYLQQADVFILTSRDEALPISIIEAMAFGKPIISTNAGGVAETIRTGKNGFVADVEDATTLAKYITRLYQDSDLRGSLGKQAQKDYQATHTLAHFGGQMERLLLEMHTVDD